MAKETQTASLKKYIITGTIVWSLIVSLSLMWNVYELYQNALKAAKIENHATFNKDIAYRRWATNHGGVYAPITEQTPPNPYLSHIKERDITTPSGKELTLINPAYMTRQVHEMSIKEFSVRGHITSLNPIRPENAPDPWEEKALMALEGGQKEISTVSEIGGEPYMRLMLPVITEKGCLKCHAKQGYKVGQIRGGISVSTPLAPHLAIAKKGIGALLLGHCTLWILGLSIIIATTKRIKQQTAGRKKAEEQELIFKRLAEASGQGFGIATLDTKIIYVNPILCQLLREEKAEDTYGKSFLEYYPEKIRKKFDKEIIPAVMKNGQWFGELVIHPKEGKCVLTYENFFLIKDEKGKPLYLADNITDITNRKQDEREQRLNKVRFEALYELSQMINQPENAIMDFTLEKSVQITQSKIGYIYLMNEDETELTLHAWSKDVMKECKVLEVPAVYKVKDTGLWGEAVRQRKPVITNDYDAPNPLKRGYPKGHVPVKRHMNIPLIDNGKIVLIAGVGNKKDPYDESDVKQLTLIMSGMWRIVQKKRTEEALFDSERRFRGYFELGLVGMAVISPEMGWIDANDRLCEILSYTRDELTSLTWAELTHPDDLESDVSQFGRIISGRIDGYSMDKRFIRKDGQIIYASISVKCIRNKDGSVNHFAAIIQDISKRKRIENELRMHRSHLEDEVAKRTQDLTEINIKLEREIDERKNTQEELTQANKLVQRQLWLSQGRSELSEIMRGEKSARALADEISAYLAGKIRAEAALFYITLHEGASKYHLSGGYGISDEYQVPPIIKTDRGLLGRAAQEKRCVVADSNTKDVVAGTLCSKQTSLQNIVAVPFVFEDSVSGLVELATKEKLTIDDLDFLENISETVAVALNSVISRERTRVLLDEKQAQTMLLESQQEALKKAYKELEEKTQYLNTQKNDIEAKNRELEITRRFLEQKAQDLEAANKYKSEFLANVSHELRTPLNSLLILSRDLAANKMKNLKESQIESASIIHRSGNELLTLINEILDLSKIEAGRMVVNIEKVHLSEVADNIEVTFKHLIEEKGLKFEISIGGGVSEIVQSDRQRLEQILKNLISNAVKFTDKGKVSVEFYRPPNTVDLSESGLNPNETVAISVSDTGIGIPEEKHEDIFEAFQQVDGSTSRQYGGTGLGLCISRELVRLLGGQIELTSKIGEGSTFIVYIPQKLTEEKKEKIKPSVPPKSIPKQDTVVTSSSIKRENETEVKQNKEKKSKQSIKDDRNKIKEGDKVILMVESNISFLKTLYKLCHNKGLKCICASDGKGSLELIEKFKPDAVLLDIEMPDLDGKTILEMVADNFELRHIPIHIMSDQEKDLDCLHKWAIGCLAKPADEDGIKEALERITQFVSKKKKELLVVEKDEKISKDIINLIGDCDVEINTLKSDKEAIERLKTKSYDCMILGLKPSDISAIDILSEMALEENVFIPPVICYSGKKLTPQQEQHIQEYSDILVVKSVNTRESLLDEVLLFLHKQIENLPDKKKKMVRKLHDKKSCLKGRKILIVDDDMRNIFALSKLMEDRDMIVLKAANGQKALQILSEEKSIDIVIMDIMMPVMDGYETMKHIRKEEKFKDLPILALTAKAMEEDREKCISAGATDYMAKPVDIDKLLSLISILLRK